MAWLQKHPEDESWLEWHKELMTAEYGRISLKVWLSSCGAFKASWTKPDKTRGVRVLKSKDIESAKLEATDSFQ